MSSLEKFGSRLGTVARQSSNLVLVWTLPSSERFCGKAPPFRSLCAAERVPAFPIGQGKKLSGALPTDSLRALLGAQGSKAANLGHKPPLARVWSRARGEVSAVFFRLELFQG